MNKKTTSIKVLFFVVSCAFPSYATTQRATPTSQYVQSQIANLTDYINNPEKSPESARGIATCLQITIEDQLDIKNTQEELNAQASFYKARTWAENLPDEVTQIKKTPLISAIHQAPTTDYLTHHLALLDLRKKGIAAQYTQKKLKSQRLQASLATYLRDTEQSFTALIPTYPEAPTAYAQAIAEANKAITTPKSQSNIAPFTPKELLAEAKQQLQALQAYEKEASSTTTKEPLSITYEKLYEGIIQKWYNTLSEQSTISTRVHRLLASSIQDLRAALQIEMIFAHEKLLLLKRLNKIFKTSFLQKGKTTLLNCSPHQASAGSQAWQMIRCIVEERFLTTLYLAKKELQMQVVQHLTKNLGLSSHKQGLSIYTTQVDPKRYLYRLTTPNSYYHSTQQTLGDIWQACQKSLYGTEDPEDKPLFRSHLALYKENHTQLYNFLMATLQVGVQAAQEKAIACDISGIVSSLKKYSKRLHRMIQALTEDLASVEKLLKVNTPDTFIQLISELSCRTKSLLERIQRPAYPQCNLQAQQKKAQQELLVVIKHQIKMLSKERQTLGKIGDLNLSLANKAKILSEVDDEDPDAAQIEKEVLKMLFDALAPQQHTAALQAISLKLTATAYQQVAHKPVSLRHISHPETLDKPSRKELENVIERLQGQQQTFHHRSELYQTYATVHPIVLHTAPLSTLLQTLANSIGHYANSYYLPMASPQSTLAARRYRARYYTQLLHITNGLVATIYQHHRGNPKKKRKITLTQALLKPIPMILLSKGGEVLIMNRGKLAQAYEDICTYQTIRAYGTSIGTTLVNEKILTAIFQSSAVNRIIRKTGLSHLSYSFNQLSKKKGLAQYTHRYLTHFQNQLWSNSLQTGLGLMMDYPYYTLKSREQNQPLHELFDPSFKNICADILCSSLIDAAAATGANAIADYYQAHHTTYEQQVTWYHYCVHKMLHGLLGGSIAALHQSIHNRDIAELLEAFLTGAQSGMVAEAVTESFFNAFERTLHQALKNTHTALEAESEQAEKVLEKLKDEQDQEVKAFAKKIGKKREKRGWIYCLLWGTKDLEQQIEQQGIKSAAVINAAVEKFNQKQEAISEAWEKANQTYQTNVQYKLEIAGSLGKIAALTLAAHMHQNIATAYKAADNAIEHNSMIIFGLVWGVRACIAYNLAQKIRKVYHVYQDEGSEVAFKHFTAEVVEELIWMAAFVAAGPVIKKAFKVGGKVVKKVAGKVIGKTTKNISKATLTAAADQAGQNAANQCIKHATETKVEKEITKRICEQSRKAAKKSIKTGEKLTKKYKKTLIVQAAGSTPHKDIVKYQRLIQKQDAKKLGKLAAKSKKNAVKGFAKKSVNGAKVSNLVTTTAAKNLGKKAMKKSKKTARAILVRNKENGKRAEEIVRKMEGLTGKKKRIQISKTKWRVPDGETTKQVIEVKCTQKLSLTAQLKDYMAYAKQKGKQFTLYIKEEMNQLKDLSKPLREQIQKGNIVLKTYKFTPAL